MLVAKITGEFRIHAIPGCLFLLLALLTWAIEHQQGVRRSARAFCLFSRSRPPAATRVALYIRFLLIMGLESSLAYSKSNRLASVRDPFTERIVHEGPY